MTRRWGKFTAVCTVVLICAAAGCDSSPDSSPPRPSGSTGALEARLVVHDSCESALQAAKQAALTTVGAYGLVDSGPHVELAQESATAAKTAERHSTTNIHESAADEPDLVKTDGRRLVSVIDGKLRVIEAASRAVTVSVDLGEGRPRGLFLDGDRALVVAHGLAAKQQSHDHRSRLQTRLVQVDLVAGQVTGELTVRGSYIDARATDGVARVVITSPPHLAWTRPANSDSKSAAIEHNKDVIRNSTIDDWLPQYTLRARGAQSSGRLVDCERVHYPNPATGTSLLTVLTLDVDGELDRGDPVSVAGNGATVYGNGKNLYVLDAGGRIGAMPTTDVVPSPTLKQRTRVYQFDVSGSSAPRFVASGAVDGALLNQYSISEHEGHLRLATTTTRLTKGRRPDSESAVTVLRAQGKDLEPVGAITGLGKGERIYSVRFLGDTGYVVTFRQVDPLYRIDLSDPGNPRLAGELKITGYSSYLHPIGTTRLLGIGQEANTNGGTVGMQASLFDVSGGDPRRLAQLHIPGAFSSAERDAHAFLYWPERNLVVVPVRGRAEAGAGALVLRVSDDRVERVGQIRHDWGKRGKTPDSGEVRRALVIGDELWTVSTGGAQANDLASLDPLAEVRFR